LFSGPNHFYFRYISCIGSNDLLWIFMLYFPTEKEEEKQTSTLKKKVAAEKKEREHLLQLNQILAKQVMEKSKMVAGKYIHEPYLYVSVGHIGKFMLPVESFKAGLCDALMLQVERL
jgi:hypothetical protein